MTVHYFRCKSCGSTKSLECIDAARVAHGPYCNCGKAMREVEPVQTSLLFDKHGSLKKVVRV